MPHVQSFPTAEMPRGTLEPVRRSSPPTAAAALSGRTLLPLTLSALSCAAPVAAHEAWLLPPAEITALAAAPPPEVFTSPGWMAGAAGAAILVLGVALATHARVRAVERRRLGALEGMAPDLGPLVLRLALAAMLALAATGGLPRHGTALWAEPTLFVPDMPLSMAPGFGALAAVQLALVPLLVTGFMVRAAGAALVALSVLGVAVFGIPMIDYAPHIAAPGLILAVFGAGRFSVGRALGIDAAAPPTDRIAGHVWRAALLLTGTGFVYLGITCKLAEPALVMAVLEHGGVPRLGLPLPVVALVMTTVEITAGALLALGLLVRPVAVVLIGAFTFFSMTLGENPVLHANLYGLMAMALLAGADAPRRRSGPARAADDWNPLQRAARAAPAA